MVVVAVQGAPRQSHNHNHSIAQALEYYALLQRYYTPEKQQTTDRATKYTQWRERKASNALTSFDYNPNNHLLRPVTTTEQVEVDPGPYWF